MSAKVDVAWEEDHVIVGVCCALTKELTSCESCTLQKLSELQLPVRSCSYTDQGSYAEPSIAINS